MKNQSIEFLLEVLHWYLKNKVPRRCIRIIAVVVLLFMSSLSFCGHETINVKCMSSECKIQKEHKVEK